MKAHPLISIIIPVYNAKKYLQDCVESIIGQTFQNYEIILIDDGSTDGSGTICDELMDFNPRQITVLHETNGGVSVARNKGLDIATSEFIMFVDSDDYIANDVLRNMYDLAIINNADCVLSSIRFVYTGHPELDLTFNLPDRKFDLQLSINDIFIEMYRNFAYSATVAKLFRKEIIDKNNIRFNENYSIMEDSTFVRAYFGYVHNVVCMPECGYYYRQTDEMSLMKKFNENEIDALNNRSKISNYLFRNLNKDNLNFYYNTIFQELWGVIAKLYYRSIYTPNEKYKKMRDYLKKAYFQEICGRASYESKCVSKLNVQLALCRLKLLPIIHILLYVKGKRYRCK